MGLATAIGAAVGIGGSLLSSSSQKKAANQAAETSAQNNAENVALARDIYGQNKATLNPFVQRGNAAGDQLNAMLGLGGSPAPQQSTPQPNALSQFYGQAPYGNRTAADMWGVGDGSFNAFQGAPAWGDYRFPQNPAQTPPFSTGIGDGQTAQQAADDAFDIFRNSTNYQFRLNEGLDAVNSGYAGAGVLQSGAAMRGINDYAQNMASNELANYMNALGGQQATGAGAASSLAGVGQNFAGTVIGANNMNAANQANAQLASGFNNPWSGIASLGGTILGNSLGN